MSKREIICKNEDNVEIRFSYDEDAAFFLESLDGFTSVTNKVTTSENTMIDGSTYQGSVTSQRNLVITCSMDDEYQERRNQLYKCFKPKATGTLTFIEDEERRVINYKVESVDIDEKGVVRYGTISLICPDPFFKDEQDISVSMAGWDANFEFIYDDEYDEYVHEFVLAEDDGEEIETRIAEITKEIDNDSAADNIGIEILIEAIGPVTNPAIYHQEEGIHIKVGTTASPLNMKAGDAVRITTGTNEKDVYFIRDGKETSINEYLDEESEFIQLVHGPNTFTYAADAGRDYMNVTIIYRLRYLGV